MFRQQHVRPFLLDDTRHRLPGDRLDVGRIRHRRISHDGSRIRIHQDHAVALLLEGPDSLGTRVVELGRLPDDDRPRSDDQDPATVGTQTAPHPGPGQQYDGPEK